MRNYQEVELASIVPNKSQPRQFFNEASLNELAANIRKHGLLQPLLVRPKEGMFELVLGERRYRACKLADVTQVTCEVRDLNDDAALELSLSENLHREDLTPIEEAQAYQRYMDQGFTQQQIAEKLDKTRSRIAQMRSLLKLSPWIQDLMGWGEITERHGRALLQLQKYCEQFDHGVMIGYGISETLIKVWNYDHAPATFGDAMNDIRHGEGERAHDAVLSLLIVLNHIPDHVATRINDAKITVNNLERLTEDVKYSVIYLSELKKCKHYFGVEITAEDLEWLLAVNNRRRTNDQGKCFWAPYDSEQDTTRCTGSMDVQRFIPSLNAKVWLCKQCADVFDKDARVEIATAEE